MLVDVLFLKKAKYALSIFSDEGGILYLLRVIANSE